MKKHILSFLSFLGLSFFLSGLQGNLYFLPFALPYFWFIIFSYYSFKKSLLFSLFANLLHVFVLSSFTATPISQLIVFLNLITFVFVFTRERFHTGLFHIALASGTGCLFFVSATWALQAVRGNFHPPSPLTWLWVSLFTFVCAPPLIWFLNNLDEKIYFERVDTLENLRI